MMIIETSDTTTHRSNDSNITRQSTSKIQSMRREWHIIRTNSDFLISWPATASNTLNATGAVTGIRSIECFHDYHKMAISPNFSFNSALEAHKNSKVRKAVFPAVRGQRLKI